MQEIVVLLFLVACALLVMPIVALVKASTASREAHEMRRRLA